MRVDITELDSAGRGIAIHPAVDLAEAFPDDDERGEVMASLATRGEAMAGGGAAPLVRITLVRRRPPETGSAFAIRVRPKTGPTGAAAPHLNESVAPRSGAHPANAPRLADRLADRIAAVMQRRAAETGACTVRDLRQAGLSYRQITRHADAAREVIAAAELA